MIGKEIEQQISFWLIVIWSINEKLTLKAGLFSFQYEKMNLQKINKIKRLKNWRKLIFQTVFRLIITKHCNVKAVEFWMKMNSITKI